MWPCTFLVNWGPEAISRIDYRLWPRAVLPMGPGPLIWDTQANRKVMGIKVNFLAVTACCNSWTPRQIRRGL